MKVTWIYTGPDNQSHFEDLEVPEHAARYGTNSDEIPVTQIIFRETPLGGQMDFHPAPRRQFVVTLSGVAEIECGDGSKRRLRDGEILLADDTTGQGHITREIEGPRKGIFIFLSPEADPSAWKIKK